MDFNERVIPGLTANFLLQEAIARYQFALRVTAAKPRLILDVGCGTGYGTALLAQRGTAVGLDIDSEAVDYAQQHYPRATFITGSALKLPFPNNQADVVVSFETIEHFPQTRKFLSEVSRVLKKRGVFILSTPNARSNSPYHAKYFTHRSLTQVLGKYFSKVTIYGQFKSPKSQSAFQAFLYSQSARQTYVDSDVLGLRKIIPRYWKELIWKYLGALHGRQVQERLSWRHFPITQQIENCEYLIAVCRK